MFSFTGVIVRKTLRKVSSSGNRRYWGGVALGQPGFCTSWAVDIQGDRPEWVEVVDVKLPVRGLGDAFEGQRIVNRYVYHSGLYRVGGKKLYVNRGLGRLGRALFDARPEITVFTLCAA